MKSTFLRIATEKRNRYIIFSQIFSSLALLANMYFYHIQPPLNFYRKVNGALNADIFSCQRGLTDNNNVAYNYDTCYHNINYYF